MQGCVSEAALLEVVLVLQPKTPGSRCSCENSGFLDIGLGNPQGPHASPRWVEGFVI